ncbi:tyrosine-protein phosphatase [Dysgonomonas capnocytophagoides]|uniref:tyrosine-protein phosphatase n=1 Tax=Dysgonomonas capnocytophagoides TaxID=45254 RepID=UPI0033405FF0
MKISILAFISSLIVFYNCSSKPFITALCEKDSKGNYIVKWEIYPETDNTPVEIYESDNDSVFPSTPSYIANSNDYMAVIKNSSENGSNKERKYFRLKVAGTVSDIITNRFFDLDSIQNFRDIGGYMTTDNRRVRWGKIYRSGSFSRMTQNDSLELNQLNIKTAIDLRSEDAKKQILNRYSNVNNIRIPVVYDGYSSITQKVLNGTFLKGDAVIYTQDTYRDMVYNYAKQYAAFFDYLCDEKNYPLVYYCYLGKDQTGLATYFLLRALDVPLDEIEDDYMQSGTGIDRSKLIRDADSLSESRQEALTMLTKTDLLFLKYGISCMREKSGSVDNYMLNELELTPKKIQKLKSILLH